MSRQTRGAQSLSQHLSMDHVRSLDSYEQHQIEMNDLHELGELKIFVPEAKQKPKKVPIPATTTTAATSERKDDDTMDDVSMSAPSAFADVAEPVVLRVTYSLSGRELLAGLHFLKPTPYAPNRIHQLVTTSSYGSGIDPGLWMPCIDQLDERCTWAIDICVSDEYLVVASGNLLDRSPGGAPSSNLGASRTLWRFAVDTHIACRGIGIAIAPFLQANEHEDRIHTGLGEPLTQTRPGSESTLSWLTVPSRPAGLTKSISTIGANGSILNQSTSSMMNADETSASEDGGANATRADAATYALLKHTLAAHLPPMMALYENLFGSSYPFGTFKVLLMEEVHSRTSIGFANFVVLDRDSLYDASLIDPVYTTTNALAYAVAFNWVSCCVFLDSYADWWILQGMASWAASYYTAQVFGMNELKWHTIIEPTSHVLDEDAEQHPCFSSTTAIDEEDPPIRIYDARPLYWPGYMSHTDLENPLYRAKAQLVWRMLDQRIGGNSSTGVSGVTPNGSGANTSTATVTAGLKNLVLRIMDEFSVGIDGTTGGDDTDDVHTLPKLSTVRLLELCIELAGTASGIASLKSTNANASGGGAANDILMAEHGETLRLLFEQWIFCTGYPSLKIDFGYSAKRKVSLIQIEQSVDRLAPSSTVAILPSPNGTSTSTTATVSTSPYLRFHGPMKFRIHEVDRINDQERNIPLTASAAALVQTNANTMAPTVGSNAVPGVSSAAVGTSYLQIGPNQIEFEFICSSKVRRNRKRKKMDESGLAALALDKLLVRHNDTPILYCRVDPLCSWFPSPQCHQPDIHLLWKLLHERELLGQYNALRSVHQAWRQHLLTGQVGIGTPALERSDPHTAARDATSGMAEEKLPDDIYPKTIWSIFRNQQLYVHIRLLAAKCLAESVSPSFAPQFSHSQAHMKYVHLLLDWFKKEYFENYTEANKDGLPLDDGTSALSTGPSSSGLNSIQLRTNSFKNISDYILKSSLPLILSRVRLATTSSSSSSSSSSATNRVTISTPTEITRFLLTLLKHNDNTDNPYSDVFYVGAIIESLGNVKLGDYDTPLMESIQLELMRYLNYDQVVPSYRYHLTQKSLLACAKLERTGQLLRLPNHNIATSSASTQANDTIVPYLQYAGPSYDRSVRLAAFKSLIMVLPVKPSLLKKMIDIVEKESMSIHV